MRARALNAVLITAVAALILAACGGADIAGTASPGGEQPPTSVQQQAQDHNQADISFAQAMIPHHAQAIRMAQLAPDRAQAPQVKELASRIEQAQRPEIGIMTSWLRAWNAPVLPAGASGGDHSDGMGTGGMDPQQMQQLEQATGAQFDRLFLQMMIKHHDGAIEMASTELDNGQSSEAKQLAQQIIDAQRAEIDKIQTLLPPG